MNKMNEMYDEAQRRLVWICLIVEEAQYEGGCGIEGIWFAFDELLAMKAEAYAAMAELYANAASASPPLPAPFMWTLARHMPIMMIECLDLLEFEVEPHQGYWSPDTLEGRLLKRSVQRAREAFIDAAQALLNPPAE